MIGRECKSRGLELCTDEDSRFNVYVMSINCFRPKGYENNLILSSIDSTVTIG
jgi:hypothetical protein